MKINPEQAKKLREHALRNANLRLNETIRQSEISKVNNDALHDGWFWGILCILSPPWDILVAIVKWISLLPKKREINRRYKEQAQKIKGSK